MDTGPIERLGPAVAQAARNLAAFLVLALGAILCVAGSYLDGLPAWLAKALELIGTAFIAGGVFAWLTKIAQLQGAIRQELESIIYDPRHLALRKDVEHLWTAASRALHSDSFEPIAHKLYRTIRENFLPSRDKPFYYERAERVVELELIDPIRRIIRLKNTFQAVLVPEANAGTFPRYAGLRLDSYPKGCPPPQIDCQILAPATRSPLPLRVNCEHGPDGLSVKKWVNLTQGQRYLCVDTSEYFQCLDEDNWALWRASSFVDGMSVEVHYDPSKLLVQFRDVGMAKFEPAPIRVKGRIRQTTDGLLFANSGYILSVQISPPPLLAAPARKADER